MLNMAALLIFPALMAFAASSDLLTMKISNWLIVALVAGFAALALAVQMPLMDFAVHFGVAAAVLAVTFTFFSFGWIGGGDAKLAAATALWFGPELGLSYLFLTAVWGGTLTLLFLGARHYPLPLRLQQVEWIERLHAKTSGIPYGIAMAAAALILYPQSAIFRHFAG